MLGWAAGIFWGWRLWAWLGVHVDLSSAGLYLQDLGARLSSGGVLSTWDLPPAPALFPDLGLWWVARSFSHDPASLQRVYGLLLGVVAWKYLARLIRALWPLPKGLSRALAAAGLLSLLLLSPADSGFTAWLLPGQHGTAWVAALMAWAWLLRQKERPSGWTATLWVAALSGLMAANDPWFLVWVLPGLCFLPLRLRSASWLRLGVGLLLAWGVAAEARHWLAVHSAHLAAPTWNYVLGVGSTAWANAYGRLRALWLVSLPLAVAGSLGALVWSWPQGGRHSGLRVLWLSWSVGALLGLLVAGALDLDGLGWSFVLFLPILLLPALLVERWPALTRTVLLVPILASLLWWAGRSAGPSLSAQRQTQAQWLATALAPAQAHDGWASVSLARSLRLLAPGGPVVLPMATDKKGVVPVAWASDRSLLVQGAALDAPQFVVVNGLDEDRLRARLGVPQAVTQGAGLTLWILTPSPRMGL